jgi:hypothetical protein
VKSQFQTGFLTNLPGWMFGQFLRSQIFTCRRSGGKMIGHLAGDACLVLTMTAAGWEGGFL